MELETISIKKQDALEKLQAYREALKREKSQELQSLARLYRAASQGKRILDFYETMRKAGTAILNGDGDPRIGIAAIGWKRVAFSKSSSYNTPIFTYHNADESRFRHPRFKFDVTLPADTFPRPQPKQGQNRVEDITTIVPMVPVQHRPVSPNSETLPYYILWEVDKWESRAPLDPYLLRRATKNLFVIEARWNTTKLERAFINGRVRA